MPNQKNVSPFSFARKTFKWHYYPIKIRLVYFIFSQHFQLTLLPNQNVFSLFVFEQHFWVSLLPDQNTSSRLYSSITCKLRKYIVSMHVWFIFEQQFLRLAMSIQKTCHLFHLPETLPNHNTWNLFFFSPHHIYPTNIICHVRQPVLCIAWLHPQTFRHSA